MDEEQGTKEEKSEDKSGNSEEGHKYETTPIIERAREERERMEAVVKELREENTRRELIMAKSALGGNSEAGSTPEKPKKMSDSEYAEALERGEVNPLKEDGLI